MTPPDRLLIVLLGAIGDVVCGMPLAQRLRAGWPTTRVTWAVEPAAAPLLQGHPAVHAMIMFRRGGGWRAFAEFLRRVRHSRPQVTLDLQRHLKSGVTSLASRAPRRVGFHWRNSREGNWFFNTETIAPVDTFTLKLTHFQRFADLLGVPPAPISFGLAASAEERARAQALLAPLGAAPIAVLYVGSTWTSRQWMPAATAALCGRLRERGFGVALVGGQGDVGFADAVIGAGAGRLVNTVGQTKLREIVAIMERATVAIGPDTGPMHIAAAVGTPVVALFGATSPRRSGPWGWDDLVVRGDAPCAPCYLPRCPIGHLCMQQITPELVMAHVERALAR
ncbi:MAG: glycosyltransferase family 9 protein [Deltaproteobacteria bacterium]|nr:glycosyltransferase family 9 protein [Deltaproteobacteria bacterium]